MTELPDVGPWAKEKLDILSRYLDAYRTVLKNKGWRTVYVDAFAGGGRAIVRSEVRPASGGPSLFLDEQPLDAGQRELIDGSPRVALDVANPFSRYVFIDPNPARVSELETLKTEYQGVRAIDVLPTTAADGIAWVLRQKISRRSHRGVAFLDPFGAQLDWASVQRLADTRLFEVVVNFPLNMTIQRMLPNDGNLDEAWSARLDAYFGTKDWFDLVYQEPRGTLFEVEGLQKDPNYSVRILEFYQGRLKAAFGYVSAARLIRNTPGRPLYYILWAGPHELGLKIANHILKMGERLPRQSAKRPAH